MEINAEYSNALFTKKRAFRSAIMLSIFFNIILVLCFTHFSVRNNPLETIRWEEMLQYLLFHFLSNVLMLYVINSVNYRIIRRSKNYKRAAFRIVIATMLVSGILSPILSQIQWMLITSERREAIHTAFMTFSMAKDVVLSVLALFEIGLQSTSYQRQQTLILNQELRVENIRARYEALKNQLDPHFLFNSLNTLNGLIGVDDEKAHEYVENLSSMFRYTLHSKSICTLNEEMGFVSTYINLLRIRYGENLVVQYCLDEAYKGYFIMPISIQLLVENVIKHNVISDKKPLFILIETTQQETIIVKNFINLKRQSTVGISGVGLANLTDRYSILFGKSITIKNDGGTFAVEIPLFKEMPNDSNKNKDLIGNESCCC